MSMSFTRKRSIDKRGKGEENSGTDTLNTTKTSFRPLSSRAPSANNKNYQECIQRVQELYIGLDKILIDKLEKKVS